MAAVLALLPIRVQADNYSCTTERGRVTADTRPPECESRPTLRIRSDGRSEYLEPNLTPEQLRQRADEEKRQLEERERAREKMRQDFWLLDRYRNSAEIDADRDHELAALQIRLEDARKRIEELNRDRKKLLDEAEFYAKRPMPESLRSALEANSAALKVHEKIVSDTQAEMERVNRLFDGRVRRFLELTDPRRTRPVPDTK